MMGYYEAWRYALRRNPGLRVVNGFKVTVPRGTKRAYIPRRHHYSRTVGVEENEMTDMVQPCVVTRGQHGFGLHECKFHSKDGPMGPVYIQEAVQAT